MNLTLNVYRTAKLTFTFGLLLIYAIPTVAQQTGKVLISSLNPKEEIVPFIEVIIEGNGLKRTLKPTGDGDGYENGGLMELPVGTYHITSRNGNYYPFRRAPFQVEAGSVIKLNVSPVLRVLVQALRYDERHGMHDEYQFAPAPKYSYFDVPNASKMPAQLIIRYGTKRSRRGSLEYKGDRIVGGAMASYEALAIYANGFRFDPRSLLLEAEGDVILEDGKGRTREKKLVISFKNGAPEILRN